MKKQIRIGLAIVFLLAGIYKLIFFQQALQEMAVIGLPWWISLITIGVELVCGTLLILNKYVKLALILLIMFLVSAIGLCLILNPQIFSTIPALFTFQPEITDVWLHILYLIVLIIIFKNQD